MVWTVFERNVGRNETKEDAPGRGGYKYVLVPLPSEAAVEWWEDEYDENPRRRAHYDQYGNDIGGGEQAWHYRSHLDPDDARGACGEIEMDAGGIGVPMTRSYTWSELSGRLDVRVVTADEVPSADTESEADGSDEVTADEV